MNFKKIPRPSRLGFLCYVGDVQGCGTIRVIYPYFLLNHYRKKDLMCSAMYLMNYVSDVGFYKDFAYIQFQRSATPEHLKLIQHFKSTIQNKFPIPIIYEIDDMLFDIPDWNYASVYYNKARPVIEAIMRSCDGMITSTAKLREIYSPYCKRISVIPNHLPKFIWGDIFEATDYKDENKKIKILWAGSQNHFSCKAIMGDHAPGGGDFGKGLFDFIRKTVDTYEWHIMGAIPDDISNLKNKIHFHPWENIFQYPSKLKSIEPDICIAPLQDIEFNRGKCLVGNTRISTNKGIMTIEEMFNKSNKLQFEHLQWYIWQENCLRYVSDKVKYEKRKTIKIKTYNGFEIEGTENHKLRSFNKFKMLSEFKIGDFVDIGFFDFSNQLLYQELSAPLFLTKKLDDIDFDKLNESLLPKVKINERWGRFIGYVLGDGHLRTSNSISISCNIDYQDIIDDIIKFAKEIGMVNLNFVEKKVKKENHHKYRKNKGIDVIFNSRNLKWFLGEKVGFKGRYEKNLDVPEVILKSPKSVIKEFIRGLFEADGTVSVSNSNCSFTTKHEKLAKEVQFLLLGFNIISRISGKKIGGKIYYTVKLNRQACDIFQKEINFISKDKKEKLKIITDKKHSNAYKEWELNDEIIEISYGEEDVYDIQVPDGRYYLANGIISHNSNIKCLEYTAVGAPAVFSDVTPYKFQSLKSSTDEEMIAHIEKLAGDIDYRARIYKKDYQRIKPQLWWEENDNLKKYINTYLNMWGKCL